MATQTLENPVIQVSGTATVEPSVEVANLCEIKDGQVVTTSLRVAEIFSKEHNHVLRAIRELDCSDDFRASNFGQSFRIRQLPNGMGERQDPYYLITRDGFVFLVMGFTGKTAAKFKEAYIRAFNVMEERLRRMQSSPQYTMTDAPRLVHEHLERMEAEEQPIVEFYGKQRVVSSVTLARLTGRKHDYVCDSIRAAMKWALRPSRQFYRTTRTVRKGFGKGYDYPQYNHHSPDAHRLRKFLEWNKVTIGWHSSYYGVGSIEQRSKRRDELSVHRSHYLNCSIENMRKLVALGITDDYTMGFADQAGFRLQTSRAVLWIDPERMQLTELVLHPLIIMDVTLSSKNYMALDQVEATYVCQQLIDKVRMHNGDLCLLWHNTSINQTDYHKSLYPELLLSLR